VPAQPVSRSSPLPDTIFHAASLASPFVSAVCPAADAIYRLRNSDQSGTAEQDITLVEAIYFSWDSSKGEMALDLSAPSRTLCEITGRVSGGPDWLILNIAMGTCDFGSRDVLGVCAEVTGPQDITSALFIRSRVQKSIFDTPLNEPLRRHAIHKYCCTPLMPRIR
jgi:hypothetical protein